MYMCTDEHVDQIVRGRARKRVTRAPELWLSDLELCQNPAKQRQRGMLAHVLLLRKRLQLQDDAANAHAPATCARLETILNIIYEAQRQDYALCARNVMGTRAYIF